jgi:spore germination cell wall hydrolase CwlJ-like protein
MYPNTVCEVVRQGPHRESWRKDGTYHPVKHKCQFSWYCDGKPDKPNNIKQYDGFFSFALLIIQGKISLLDITDGALWYHADYVTPSWAKHKKRTTEIGDHIFYTINDEK